MKRAWGAVALSASLAAPAAAQVPAGGEIAVNTYTTGAQDDAAVAVTRDGRFVVVWESPQDDSDDAVAARRYDAAGTALGGEIAVNAGTLSNQDDASVAVGPDGRFVVVWESLDGSGDGIFGQRFDAAGARLGAEFRVNTSGAGAEYAPSAAMLSNGGFVVTWSVFALPGPVPDGSNGAVMARLYDAAGAARGDEFVVNTYTPGYQSFGYAASSANGTFVITWHSRQIADAAYDIFGQRFDVAGQRLGAEFQVNAGTEDSQFSYPAAMSDDGRFVVLWLAHDGDDNGIFGRRFDAGGAPLGPDFRVNTWTTGNQALATASSDASFNFVATWYSEEQDGSGRGVFGQRFDSSGAPRGGEFAVNTYTTGEQNDPWVGSDAVGNFVVAWESPQDPGGAVRARRFGGLFPVALTLNPTGNAVWEPGESVDVRPSWRNLSGADQTFGATLGGLGGPAGGTYTVEDGTAGYGTVANGASVICADCYRVSVDDPSPRPVQHWDASAVESITPDAQGQRKRWTLHIGRSFTDVALTSPFYRFIETLLHHGITGGCGATSFCPGSATLRDQMSVFMLLAKEGPGYQPPACTTPLFNDVPASSPFCRFIEELARRAVVGGCGGGNYCPTSPVTREQMAVFVLRTLRPEVDPPACVPPNIFNDVPETSPFCRWIEELANGGVVAGCGGGNYCPTLPVTREQMAVFVTATLGLSLYGP